MLGEVAQVLGHLSWAGRAVEPDHVDAQGLERGQRRPDLRADEHRAGGLDGHLHEPGDVDAGRADGATGSDDGRLGLQQILRGLDEHGVDAAREHARGLRLVRIAQRGVGRMSERGELGAGADGAEDESWSIRGAVVVGHLARGTRPGAGELLDAVRDVVLAEVGEVGTEGVGLDRVDPDREVGVVDRPDDIGPGDVEDLVAALVPLEIVQGQVMCLQHRAHRAVGDDDSGGEGVSKCGGARFGGFWHNRGQPNDVLPRCGQRAGNVGTGTRRTVSESPTVRSRRTA